MGIYNTFVCGFILPMRRVYYSCVDVIDIVRLRSTRISDKVSVPRGTIRITYSSRICRGRRCVGKRAELKRLKPFCSLFAGFSYATTNVRIADITERLYGYFSALFQGYLEAVFFVELK